MPRQPKPPDDAIAGGERKRRVDWSQHGAGNYGGDSDREKWSSSMEGDTITGRITRVEEVTTRFGAKTVIEMDDCREVVAVGESLEDGAYVLWPTSGLIDALDRTEADLGDLIVISLEKLIPSSYGNPFKQYGAEVLEQAF